MPIRLVDDEPEDNLDNNSNEQPQNDDTGGSGRGGIGGGLMSFLPILLPLLLRYPKLLLFAALGFGAFYLFGKGCGGSGGGARTSDNFSTGMEMKQSEFDKAKVFEPLAAGSELPTSVTLQQFCPRRDNQGAQGSCVAWASAYAARTILEAQATGKDPNSTIFSPSYLYNQIHLPSCQGAYMPEALKVLTQQGLLPLKDFPYSDQECDRTPNSAQKEAAGRYKITGFNRLTNTGDDYGIDIQGIKQNLAQGAPILIGAMVTNSFMQNMRGSSNKIWQPSSYDKVLGGHAMCVVGYDDNLVGGAFQIMNSWGEDWGDKGFGWVRYNDFKNFCKEAYGLHPLPHVENDGKLDINIGLLENKTKKYIPLSLKSANLFTSQPVNKMTTFKIQVSNTIECYTYVFGQETDNSSYTLFPYSPKYSAFCGITGTRVFPRSKSLQPDNTGNQDYMAIVVSKKELDYEALNKKVNASTQTSFLAKFKEAIGSDAIPTMKFAADADGIMRLTAEDHKGHNTAIVVVEMNKK